MSISYSVEQSTQSIVFVGGFNTLNITHEWLLRFNLISQEDYDSAKLTFLDARQMRLELSWVVIQVAPVDEQKCKLVLTLTDEGSLSLFSDLVLSLAEAFITTTVTALGINFTYKVLHSDLEDWHAFGHKLMPKQFWKSIFLEDKDEDSCHFGMNNVSLKIDSFIPSVKNIGENKTELNVSIKPYHDHNGQFKGNTEITLNYHFPILEEQGMEMVIETFRTHHSDLCERSPKFANQLITENI